MRNPTRLIRAATLILVFYSATAFGAWRSEQVSAQQMGPLASGKFEGDQDRLFAAKWGNGYDGRIFELSLDGGNWDEKVIHSAKTYADEMTIGSDCGAKRSLFLGLADNNGTVRLHQNGKEWTGTTRRRYSPMWADVPISDARTFDLVDGTTIAVVVDPDVDSEWLKCEKMIAVGGSSVAKPDQFRVIAVGDLRGDGVRRYYGLAVAFGLRSGHFVIFELTPKGKRWAVELLTDRASFAHPNMFISDARGDGRPALYATFGSGLTEIRWNGKSWEVTTVGRTHIAAGMAYGAFRSDRRKRIYVADGHHIVEHSYEKTGWRTETIFPHKGVLSHFIAGRAQGQAEPGLFFSIMNRGGLYQLKWKDGDRVVVAPFAHDSSSKSESLLLSDLIRVKMVAIGNCAVLEREQMDKLMTERQLRDAGETSSVYAVRLGRLLNAKKVVVGNVGRLFSSRVATVDAVSVETGAIERSEFGQWKDASTLEKTAETLAQSICPAEVDGD